MKHSLKMLGSDTEALTSATCVHSVFINHYNGGCRQLIWPVVCQSFNRFEDGCTTLLQLPFTISNLHR